MSPLRGWTTVLLESEREHGAFGKVWFYITGVSLPRRLQSTLCRRRRKEAKSVPQLHPPPEPSYLDSYVCLRLVTATPTVRRPPTAIGEALQRGLNPPRLTPQSQPMKFAKWTFGLAALYGLLVLVPHYYCEEKLGRDFPPAITHPEQFYGFLGVSVAWQFAFILLAHDPGRYRPMMLVAVLEKAGYGIAVVVLFSLGRVPSLVLGTGLADLMLGVLFLAAAFA